MSGIPKEIPDLGDAGQKVRQNPSFVPGAGFGTDDYFVWSRCDGTASLHDIILMVGFPTTKSVEILSKLRQLGAVLLPGETKPPPGLGVQAASGQPAPKPTAAPKPSEPNPTPPPTLDDPTEEEARALELDVAISKEERIRILQYRRRIGAATLFELLEIEEEEADKRSIKRAYFRLSKEFHPDRHYGKDIGPFTVWLSDVFKAVTNAFNVLGDRKKRARYEAELRGDSGLEKPQTKEEHAHALFQNACDAELRGDTKQALKFFAASIRMDERPRVLRRAAMCAVQAHELSVAEEYAKKAAHLSAKDASYLRTLADVYRAGRRFHEAREVLEQALELDTENDVLFTELKSDLAAVQANIEELEAE